MTQRAAASDPRPVRPDCTLQLTWRALFAAFRELERERAAVESERRKLANHHECLREYQARLRRHAGYISKARAHWRWLMLGSLAMGVTIGGFGYWFIEGLLR